MQSGSAFDGLVRACRYSFITNRLGYCGSEGAFGQFDEFLKNPSPALADKIRALFPTFPGLYAYLRLIGESNGLQPLDSRVVEAYWLGNELLGAVPSDAVAGMIRRDLCGPGLLPKTVAEAKASPLIGLPAVYPHHSFHVLHVNFVTGKVEPVLPNLNKCIIQWGKVESVDSAGLQVAGIRLDVGEGGFFLTDTTKRIARGLACDVAAGDWVSIHWDCAIEAISRRQAGALKRYTLENIRLANSIRFSALPSSP
ncbi:MAG: DUF6390 family protein [Candidatus Micrarchaeota archaeon]